MNDEITASYVLTADELIKARENQWRAQCRSGYRAGLIFMSIMAVFAGGCSYYTHGWSIPTFLFPLGGIYFLFLRKYDVRWAVRRHFKKRPDRGAQIVWIFGDDALRVKTGESETRQNWSQISKVRKASNGFLLYPNETIYYWLPLKAFVSEEDRTRTEELFRKKVKDFAAIR